MKIQSLIGRSGVVRAAAAVLTAALLMAGCASSDDGDTKSAPTAVPKGTDAQITALNWGVGSGPRSLDFNHAVDGPSWVVWGELAEPLLTVDNSGKAIPKLATSWTETPGKIVFTLRKGVRFWDGEPLTAEDVVWSLNRTGDPKQASEFAPFWVNVASVKATAPDEVTLTLRKPDSTFLFNMRGPRIYQKVQALKAGNGFGTPTGLVMGTGPYRIDKFSPATGATMTRFDGYWGTKPTVKKVEVKVISDPDALRLALQSGEVDGTFEFPLGSSSSWDKMDSVATIYGPSSGTTSVILDTTKPPFSDVHARRAVAYSIDRAGLNKALQNGHGSPAQDLAPSLLWQNYASESEVKEFTSGLPRFDFDLAAAKAELAKSATPTGFSLTVYAPSEIPQLVKTLEVLKKSLSELGITLTVKQVPVAAWAGRVTGADRDPLGIMLAGAVSANPLGHVLSLFADPGAPGSYSTYAPPTLKASLAEYKQATKSRQLEIAKTVLTQLANDLPVVPVTVIDTSLALNKKYVYTEQFTSWYSVGDEWAHSIKAAH
ncbi:ABC transporter substrate-binding protein [Kribbella yunnanensis]|uniref:ABC transporter substrate-binding protein n=1 Tax=Kribbella yunnanensis TaxID=190194 RepID=A0ABP4UW22_9ACTN